VPSGRRSGSSTSSAARRRSVTSAPATASASPSRTRGTPPPTKDDGYVLVLDYTRSELRSALFVLRRARSITGAPLSGDPRAATGDRTGFHGNWVARRASPQRVVSRQSTGARRVARARAHALRPRLFSRQEERAPRRTEALRCEARSHPVL
jgi:hypothetical protein